MEDGISERLISELSTFVAARMGLHFPRERLRDLEKAIGSAALELGFADIESCIRWFLSSSSSPARSHIEILASHLTVGETYFFRDRRVFDVLEERLLPKLIQSRRESGKYLRIWSAGCATGEEPYSIAILLSRMIPDLRDWNITILATDINPRFLKKAAEGVYGQWSFRDVAPWIKERYFRQTGDGNFEILPHLKRMVTFSYHNLAEDPYPSLFHSINAMDLVFCRNVLMYFVEERTSGAIRNFHRTLMDGGWLIVSPNEASHAMSSHFATLSFPGVILFKKENPLSPAADASSCRVIQEPMPALPPAVELLAEWHAPATPEKPGSTPGANALAHSTPEAENLKIEDRRSKPDLYQQALALYGRGCYVEAMESIKTLLSHNQADAPGMALLARICANLGNLDEALEWCEKGIAADKLNAGSYYLMATILQESGRTEAAMASLKRALYLAPDLVVAHVALGNISRQHEQYRESKKHFGNALGLLRVHRPEDVLPETEGMTAGRLVEIIQSVIS